MVWSDELKDAAKEAALARPEAGREEREPVGRELRRQQGPRPGQGQAGTTTAAASTTWRTTRCPRPARVGKVAGKLGMGGKLVDNVLPGGDDDDEDGEGGEAEADATGSGRRMPVQQSMDVAVPLERRLQPVDAVRGVPELHASGRQREPGRRRARHLHREDVGLRPRLRGRDRRAAARRADRLAQRQRAEARRRGDVPRARSAADPDRGDGRLQARRASSRSSAAERASRSGRSGPTCTASRPTSR